jgi:hypothetical protein
MSSATTRLSHRRRARGHPDLPGAGVLDDVMECLLGDGEGVLDGDGKTRIGSSPRGRWAADLALDRGAVGAQRMDKAVLLEGLRPELEVSDRISARASL